LANSCHSPEAAARSVHLPLGAAVQPDSAAAGEDSRHAGRPSGHGEQNDAQGRPALCLPGVRRPQGEGQVQDYICSWIRLLQIRQAECLAGAVPTTVLISFCNGWI
jgi:hypothetical protein